MIAYREGLGDLLADGLLPACDRLDLPDVVKKTAHWLEPMWGFPSHRDGRACEPQPSPLWIFDMLHWAIDSRDPLASHHQTGYIHCWFPPHFEGGSPLVDRAKLEATFTKVFGDPGILEPGFAHLDAKTRVTKWFDDRAQVKDSLLLCDWVFPRVLNGFDSAQELEAADDYYGDIDAEASMLAPLTGLDITTADLDRAGERIRNLDRALQIRNSGRSRAVDSTAEWVFEYPEKSDGTRLDRESSTGSSTATTTTAAGTARQAGRREQGSRHSGCPTWPTHSSCCPRPDPPKRATRPRLRSANDDLRLHGQAPVRRPRDAVCRVEPLDEEMARDFIGGYGLGARILYERMPAGVDPLGPDNLLGFVTGPFTGTPAICSGRFTVVGKSPLTGGWGDANCGGSLGAVPALRRLRRGLLPRHRPDADLRAHRRWRGDVPRRLAALGQGLPRHGGRPLGGSRQGRRGRLHRPRRRGRVPAVVPSSPTRAAPRRARDSAP